MKNSTEPGARKISFLSLAHSVRLGILLNSAGTVLLFGKSGGNSSFTVFVHLFAHSFYKWATLRLLGYCYVPGTVLGAGDIAGV